MRISKRSFKVHIEILAERLVVINRKVESLVFHLGKITEHISISGSQICRNSSFFLEYISTGLTENVNNNVQAVQ